MTLENVKATLDSNGIPYDICLYADEADFWRHISKFPSEIAKPCAVSVIVIHCKNGYKDIEIEIFGTGEDAIFVDLYFGDFSFEMFDLKKEYLPIELLRNINSILQGRKKVIVAYDLKNELWLGDACYDSEDNDYAQSDYKRAIDKIKKQSSLFGKLLSNNKLYEIYDYENYQCIIKDKKVVRNWVYQYFGY